MSAHLPVTTLDDLASLDDAEVTEGYWDGFHNEPCGDNRSRSFWHGWRNGRVDGHHAEKDDAQAVLAHVYVEASKAPLSNLLHEGEGV